MKYMLFMILAFSIIQAKSQKMEEKDYYFGIELNAGADKVMNTLKEVLKTKGFGVITEIDMKAKITEKLDSVSMPAYYILGVCNPGFAYKTIQVEENIGLFLPCKIIVREKENGNVFVAAVNPEIMVHILGNNELEKISREVAVLLKEAIEELYGKISENN